MSRLWSWGGGGPCDFRRTMNSVSCSAAGEGISRCFQWSVSRTALSYVVMDDDNFLWSVVIDCPVFFCQIVWTMYNMHSLAYVGRDRSKFIPFLLFVHVCLSTYTHLLSEFYMSILPKTIATYCVFCLYIYLFSISLEDTHILLAGPTNHKHFTWNNVHVILNHDIVKSLVCMLVHGVYSILRLCWFSARFFIVLDLLCKHF